MLIPSLFFLIFDIIFQGLLISLFLKIFVFVTCLFWPPCHQLGSINWTKTGKARMEDVSRGQRISEKTPLTPPDSAMEVFIVLVAVK